MSLTQQNVQDLLKGSGMKFFVDPVQGHIMLPGAGMNGRYLIYVLLQDEGTFLQFRTTNLAYCAADHPFVLEALKAIGSINYEVKFLKFGWDSNDGEIVGYGDIWICDGGLTQEQFTRCFGNFVSAVDMYFGRIKQVIDSGEDPGELDPADLFSRMLESMGGGLPEELRKLLEAAKKKGRGPEIDEV